MSNTATPCRLLVGLLIAATPVSLHADGAFRKMDFFAACRLARQQNKIVLIDFYTTWCVPCKLLDQTTWIDPSVQTWLNDTSIALKIDGEKESKLARKFDVGGYPTILLLGADGREIDRLVGYRDAKTFLKDAKAALAAKGAARKKGKPPASKVGTPADWMKAAQQMQESKRNREALNEYLWCFDHGLESDPTFIDVRQTLLLKRIIQLSDKYPKTYDELRTRRDAADSALRGDLAIIERDPNSGPGLKNPSIGGKKLNSPWMALLRKGTDDPMFIAALDLAWLNQAMGEPESCIALFDELRKTAGARATWARQAMFCCVFDPLLEKRRYRDLVAAGGNVPAWFAWEIEQFKQGLGAEDEAAEAEAGSKKSSKSKGRSKKSGKVEGVVVVVDRMTTLIKRGGAYYEALAGAKKYGLAGRVAKMLLKLETSPRVYKTLIESASRAGAKKQIGILLKEAKQKLTLSEYEEVSTAHAQNESQPDEKADGKAEGK